MYIKVSTLGIIVKIFLLVALSLYSSSYDARQATALPNSETWEINGSPH
jgi:hypothetical protein